MDSGFGGVSTLKQAVKLLPTENFVYFGDNANAPYGNRSVREIQNLTLAAASHLESANVKAILIACNTATAAALHLVQERLSIPVVGIRPAIIQAFKSHKTGIVLMLATEATTKLPSYQALHESLSQPNVVKDIGCPADIVRNVESGIRDDAIYIEILDRVLKPYHNAVVDGIVLGCTHYPFIETAVKKYAKEHFRGCCTIFEGGKAAITELSEILKERNLENNSGMSQIKFITSGDLERETIIYNRLLAE